MRVIPTGNDNVLAKRLRAIRAAKETSAEPKEEKDADDTIDEVPSEISENERQVAGETAPETDAESAEKAPKRKFSKKKEA